MPPACPLSSPCRYNKSHPVTPDWRAGQPPRSRLPPTAEDEARLSPFRQGQRRRGEEGGGKRGKTKAANREKTSERRGQPLFSLSFSTSRSFFTFSYALRGLRLISLALSARGAAQNGRKEGRQGEDEGEGEEEDGVSRESRLCQARLFSVGPIGFGLESAARNCHVRVLARRDVAC
jgi:hypothetical protein